MKKLLTVLFSLLFISSLSFAQWAEQTSGITTTLESISAVNGNVVWVSGESGKVLLTTNGGANWVTVTSPNTTLGIDNIWGIDANNALAAGYSTAGAWLYKTTNAGANWTQVFTQTGGFIDGITAITKNLPYFFMYGDPVGGRWSLWSSTDNGSTWDSSGLYIPRIGSEAGWNNSIFDDEVFHSHIYFGTNSSRIYHITADQNLFSWTNDTTPGITNIYSFYFHTGDSLHGIAGGDNGLAETSNGGTNWVLAPVRGTGDITGVTALLAQIWYARGDSIFYSSNGGSNWVGSHGNTATTYYHLSMSRDTSSHNIWAVGASGVISKYTYPIGIKPISSIVPKDFILYQNYPNPFNPSTTIKFDIPKSSFTTITIYDALGREVTRLVNEKLGQGKYEIKWDASNMTSGIYFYKMTTESYSLTRKLVLVK